MNTSTCRPWRYAMLHFTLQSTPTCVCAFVVLQLQSTNCLPYLNREWHTVLSTAIVESFFFDVVRLQTTNQMLLCFHTQLSCNAHIHIHVIIWGNVYITYIQCTRLRPIHKNEVNQTLQTYTLHACVHQNTVNVYNF